MSERIAVVEATEVAVNIADLSMFTLEKVTMDGVHGYQMLASHEWASKGDLKLALRATLDFLEGEDNE